MLLVAKCDVLLLLLLIIFVACVVLRCVGQLSFMPVLFVVIIFFALSVFIKFFLQF